MPTRRHALRLIALLLWALLGGAMAQEPPAKRTYVLVHGAWGGGWDWRTVADLLGAQGHRVLRVTLTGLGERVHLASPEVGLDTHINDVVNTLLYEDLRDVTLVGHSYGGMVITGVADRLPERLGHLVYVDALVPEHGESVMSFFRAGGPPGEVRAGLLVPAWVPPGAQPPMDVPQPLKTFEQPIVLSNPLREQVPATYIRLIAPRAQIEGADPFVARARARGWHLESLEADHNAQRSAPQALSALLARVR